MATSISNPATFSSVRTAFNTEGYGISTSFYAYRQGGGIVPATSEFNAIGAGTGGDPLQLSQFSGFSVPSPIVVTIDDANPFNDIVTPTGSIYELNSDGNIYISNYGLLDAWKLSGASSLYDARMTRLNGFMTSSGASLGTWLNLGTTRTWIFESDQNSDVTDCTLEIRLASTGALLDSAIITFNWVGNFE